MKKIRYAVIGIKGIGDLHCRFARQNENAELTAIADIDKKYLRKKSEELLIRGFTDYREMLSTSTIDAVSIVTPHYLHYEMCMDCLDAGVHVFVEKPLAVTISQAERIVNKARSKNLKLSVGHQYRTFRTSKTLKNLIDSGAVGNIMRVLWSWIEFRAETYYSRDIWRRTCKYSGGGISIHSAIHDLDLICWLIGKPIRVNAMLGNQLHKIDVEDVFCSNILFENNALCSFQASVNQPRGYSIRQIAGDKGLIIIEDVKSLTFDRKDKILLGKYDDALQVSVNEMKDKEGQPETKWETVNVIGDPPKWKKLLELSGLIKIKREHGISTLMNSFIDAILNDEEPLVSGQSSLQSIELVNAIIH
ncbi:MAG: Gfo/Idh/MocA family oxidoreductase [Ignavibacteriaceae bacterium]